MMPLNVEAIRSESDCVSIWEEWEALHKSLAPRTPFSSPLWNMTWWSHFSKDLLSIKSKFFLHTVRDERGDLQAVVPWMITSRPSIGPFQMRSLRYFGADQSLTEIRGAICSPEVEAEVVTALQEYLRRNRYRFDLVEWSHVKTSAAVENLEVNGPLAFAQVTPVYILSLPDTWEALNSRLSSYARKYVRRSYEKFAALGKDVHLGVVAERPEFANAMERFFVLHSSRAGAKDMFAHPDKFKNHTNRAFLCEAFGKFFDEGAARIFELYAGEQIVACRLCFVLESNLYVYYSGYDPSFREYNVGTIMMSEIIKWAIKNGFREVNLSAGKDRSKLQWRPTEIVFQGGFCITPDFRGAVISRAYDALKRIRSQRRRNAAALN
jgi:CelD/BcsL family acetyltransferase involved in cellulose biosynthesis